MAFIRCHTFVTTMLDAGVDLRDVQIAARHANLRTTRADSPKPRPPPELHPRPVRDQFHVVQPGEVTRRVWLSRVPSMWAGQTAWRPTWPSPAPRGSPGSLQPMLWRCWSGRQPVTVAIDDAVAG